MSEGCSVCVLRAQEAIQISDYLPKPGEDDFFPFRFNLCTNYHFFFFFCLKQSPLPSLDLEAIDTSFFFPFEGLAALYLESEYTNGHYEKTASPFGG